MGTTRRETKYLHQLFFYTLCLIVIITPIIRGLYFDEKFLPYALVIILMVASFLLCYPNVLSSLKIKSPLEIVILLIPLSFIISFFNASNQRLAYTAVVKIITYVSIGFLTVLLVKKKRDVNTLLHAIMVCGLIVALVGLCSKIGIISFPGVDNKGFLTSIVEYHNAFGLLMTVSLLIGMTLQLSNKRLESLYFVCNYFFFQSLLLSRSRGVWFMLPAGIVVLFLLLDSRERQTLFINCLCLIIASLSVIKYLQEAVNTDRIWKWTVAIVMLALIPYVIKRVGNYLANKLRDKVRKRSLLGAAVLLIVVFVIVVPQMKSPGEHSYGKAIKKRINVMRWENVTHNIRISYYKDALKIIKDYPILGVGGGGWRALYKKYQSSAYIAEEVHSHFLTIWLETGLIGLIVYISFIVLVVRVITGSVGGDSNQNEKILFGGICSAFTIVTLHSQIDFDMSLPSIAILYWIFIGLIIHYSRGSVQKNKSKLPINIKPFLVIILLVLSFLMISSYHVSNKLSKRARRLAQNDNVAQSEKYYKLANTLFMFNELNHVELAAVKLNMRNEVNENRINSEIVQLVDRSFELGIFDLSGSIHAARIYAAVGKYTKASESAFHYVATHPSEQRAYTELSELLIVIAEEYKLHNNVEGAMEICSKIQHIPEMIEAANATTGSEIIIDTTIYENIKKSKSLLSELY